MDPNKVTGSEEHEMGCFGERQMETSSKPLSGFACLEKGLGFIRL